MNTMQKMIVFSLIIGLCLSGTSFAGKGFRGDMKGTPGQGINGMPGAGLPPSAVPPRVNILDGTPVTITGTVYDSNVLCGGLEIQSETETVRIYGIGPALYWDELGVSLPAVGDAVSVSGYEVTFDDESVMTFVMTITVNGTEVKLRDPESGFPLWRKPPPVREITPAE